MGVVQTPRREERRKYSSFKKNPENPSKSPKFFAMVKGDCWQIANLRVFVTSFFRVHQRPSEKNNRQNWSESAKNCLVCPFNIIVNILLFYFDDFIQFVLYYDIKIDKKKLPRFHSRYHSAILTQIIMRRVNFFLFNIF